MRLMLIGSAIGITLVALSSFAFGPGLSRSPLPAPIKLSDLPLHRALHVTSPGGPLGVGLGWGIQTTLPATSGFAISQIALSSTAGPFSGTLKVEVNGAVVEARTATGPWGAYGAQMPLTDSFRFDPPIIVAPGGSLRIRGEPDSFGFTVSIAGWQFEASEL